MLKGEEIFQHTWPSLWTALASTTFHFSRKGSSRHHSLCSKFFEILPQELIYNMSDLFFLHIYMLVWILYWFLNILDIVFNSNNPSSCSLKGEIEIFQEVFWSYHQYLLQIQVLLSSINHIVAHFHHVLFFQALPLQMPYFSLFFQMYFYYLFSFFSILIFIFYPR